MPCKKAFQLLGGRSTFMLRPVQTGDQVRQREKTGAVSGKQPLAYDSQILLHVLAHREDHAASKYLKKEFALPKKLDNSSVLPGAKSFPNFSRKDSNVSTGGFKKKLSFGNFGRK